MNKIDLDLGKLIRFPVGSEVVSKFGLVKVAGYRILFKNGSEFETKRLVSLIDNLPYLLDSYGKGLSKSDIDMLRLELETPFGTKLMFMHDPISVPQKDESIISKLKDHARFANDEWLNELLKYSEDKSISASEVDRLTNRTYVRALDAVDLCIRNGIVPDSDIL
jgi:hypothetical protein